MLRRWLCAVSVIVTSLFGGSCHKSDSWADEVVLPSGKKGVAVHCDATKVMCYRLAGAKCPNGYDVIEENQMGSANAEAGHGSASASAKTDLGMMVQCKSASAAGH